MINVVKNIVDYLNKGEDYLAYKRPPSIIDDAMLMKDETLRKEYIKRHTLNSVINDEIGEMQNELPFIHKS